MRSLYIGRFVNPQLAREDFRQAEADARRAIELSPDLAEGHLALGTFFAISWLDYVRALEEYQRAVVLAPGNAEVLRAYVRFAARVGHADTGLGALRRAIVLDPLNRNGHVDLGLSLRNLRQFQESIRAFRDALAIDPGDPLTEANLGVAYYALGNFEAARTSCSIASSVWYVHLCLAMTYAKLGRQADAEAELTKVRATLGDGGAYEYARIYTQWGNSTKALECLETALRVRDPGLGGLRTDIFLDPLRKEPRFQAIERALKFPN
jgi:tetratricopeptide (TPR) repeat protein